MVLRLVTWNLWGRGAPKPYVVERATLRGAAPGSRAVDEGDPERTWSRRLPLLTGELAARKVDVVLLQECGRHNAGHAAGLLGERVGYSAVIPEPRADGLALLVRDPPLGSGVVAVDAELYGYPAPIWADVAVGGIPLRVVCVHLPLPRLGPSEPVVRALLASDELAVRDVVVLGGDLNVEPEDSLIRPVLDAGFVDVSGGCGPTMPNPDPVVRLDYLFVSGGGPRVHVLAADVFGERSDHDGFLPSDHLAVGATVEIGF